MKRIFIPTLSILALILAAPLAAQAQTETEAEDWGDEAWSDQEAETWGEAEGFEETEWNDNFGRDHDETRQEDDAWENETWGAEEGFEETEWNDNFGQDYADEFGEDAWDDQSWEAREGAERDVDYGDGFGYHDEAFDWEVDDEDTTEFNEWYESDESV